MAGIGVRPNLDLGRTILASADQAKANSVFCLVASMAEQVMTSYDLTLPPGPATPDKDNIRDDLAKGKLSIDQLTSALVSRDVTEDLKADAQEQLVQKLQELSLDERVKQLTIIACSKLGVMRDHKFADDMLRAEGEAGMDSMLKLAKTHFSGEAVCQGGNLALSYMCDVFGAEAARKCPDILRLALNARYNEDYERATEALYRISRVADKDSLTSMASELPTSEEIDRLTKGAPVEKRLNAAACLKYFPTLREKGLSLATDVLDTSEDIYEQARAAKVLGQYGQDAVDALEKISDLINKRQSERQTLSYDATLHDLTEARDKLLK